MEDVIQRLIHMYCHVYTVVGVMELMAHMSWLCSGVHGEEGTGRWPASHREL